ncbi:MAG: lipoate--protein ligase family protein [Chloroflexi bacterium]|nr:lipoate--protein ligase family protein [Chloroflexota bacterium]
MKYLDLTLPTPAQNLACDEALIDFCEAGNDVEILRFWQSSQYFVAVGYANHVADETDLVECRRREIPILRRCTGGGTVLQGPGCLNYALILRIESRRSLQSVTSTNRYIMKRHQEALQKVTGLAISVQGFTDLAVGGLKFSGNAQRRKRDYVLFHGSFLLDFDIALVEKLLRMPSKQPAYRSNRSHADFMANLNVPAEIVKQALQRCWKANQPPAEMPWNQIERFVNEKYGRQAWNLKY